MITRLERLRIVITEMRANRDQRFRPVADLLDHWPTYKPISEDIWKIVTTWEKDR